MRKRPDCPWFDGECATSKKLTRRLERQFLKSKSENSKELWRDQVKKQRHLFQYKCSSYIRQSIEEAEGNGRTLWKSLNSLLTPPTDTSSSLSPDDLLDFFAQKTDVIRESTKDAPPPVFPESPIHPHRFVAFDEVTPAEVNKLLYQIHQLSSANWTLHPSGC